MGATQFLQRVKPSCAVCDGADQRKTVDPANGVAPRGDSRGVRGARNKGDPVVQDGNIGLPLTGASTAP